MKIKLYLDVIDRAESLKYYPKVFNGSVLKDEGLKVHASVKLFDGQTLMLRRSKSGQVHFDGSFVLRLQDDESEIFDSIYKNVSEDENSEITADIKAARWGTTSFKFVDINGYIWWIEINTEAYKN